jgi:hypothetical protein
VYDEKERYGDYLTGRKRRTEKGMKAVDVKGTGECLFNALAVLLQVPTMEAPSEGGKPNVVRAGELPGGERPTGSQVREWVCAYMLSHADYYGDQSQVVLDNDGVIRGDDESDRDYVSRYVEWMSRPGTYGGFNEISAAAELFNCNIVVMKLETGTHRVVHQVTESPCDVWLNDNGSIATKSVYEKEDFRFAEDGSYKSPPLEALLKLDTLVILLIEQATVKEFEIKGSGPTPHFTAVTYNSPERLDAIALLASAELKSAGDTEMEKVFKLSFQEEKQYVQAIAARMLCGQSYDDIQKLIPDSIMGKMIAAALKVAENKMTKRMKTTSPGAGSSSDAGPP